MSERWPVTIGNADSGFVEVDWSARSGRVYIGTSVQGAMLNAAQREEFAQAFTAACHEAEGRVSHGPA